MKDIDAETKRILASISQGQWLTYHHELVIYAARKCKRLYWRGGGSHSLPQGHTAETIVEEAIKRLFEGRRFWNHERYPGENPVPFLKAVLDSIVSDLVRGEDHKRTASLEDETSRKDSDGVTYEVSLPPAADDVPGFRQEEPADPEKAAYLAEMVKRMHERVADREDLVRFFQYSEEGHSPSEIGSLMNLGITEVYQLRKLLMARLKPLIEELLQKH